jgi:hypothetical protein
MHQEDIQDPKPVSNSDHVLRLVKPVSSYNPATGAIYAIELEVGFELSSEDKKGSPPHLSVWAETLTSDIQAYSFLGADSPRKMVLRLNVEKVCSIEPLSSDGSTAYLTLLEVLFIECTINGPGAIGHAGIIGLDDDTLKSKLEKNGICNLTNRQIKNIRKDFRVQLAKLASINYWIIDVNA